LPRWLPRPCPRPHTLQPTQALNKHSGAFTAADEAHIQLFGVLLGNTLAKAKLYEEAQ
jgi:GAF domain-containing protein